ncbi:MAG: hypothetical protein HY300_05685 [Verrucomicrobia bacterium]|nr:hypothetical protein [Verrucomicrobiota bacterium]
MTRSLKMLASSTSPDSWAASFRRKRFGLFRELVASLAPSPLTILDLGGCQEFWEVMEFTGTPHRIILLNLRRVSVRHPRFTAIVGDARRLEAFADQSVSLAADSGAAAADQVLFTWPPPPGGIPRAGRADAE